MKICYLAKTQIPSRRANSVHIMKMCQAFARNGHDVTLLLPKEGADEKVDVYSYYDVEPIFKIEWLPWYQVKGQNFLYAGGIKKRLAALKPDLVYGRYLHGCLAAVLGGHPVIFEMHATMEEQSRLSQWLFSRLVKNKNLKRIVMISEALRRYCVKKYNISEEIAFVAHDGADMQPDQEKSLKTDRSNAAIRAGYVGSLYPGKGMELIYKLLEKCPDVHFDVVGGDEKDIQLWAEKCRNYNNITFHGFLPQSELPSLWAEFDILLAPYQSKVLIQGKEDVASWMSPLKIFEYMAAKKPIIASDLPVLREVLNTSNALLVPCEDLDGWRQAIDQCLNPEFREILVKNAYDDFKNHYTWTARAKNVISFTQVENRPLQSAVTA